MTRQLGAAIFVALAVFAGIATYIGSGFYGVGADTPHWDATRKLVEIFRDHSSMLRVIAKFRNTVR